MAARILRTNTSGADRFRGSDQAEIIYGWDPNDSSSLARIDAIRVASNLSQPLYATSPGADAGRLFVVEKTGAVRILDLSSGRVAAKPFLDVSSEIATEGEQGLLGLAFDPAFAQNRKAYVYMSTANGDVEIREYRTSLADPNMLDPASARLVLRIDFSQATNHRGGWIGFGPDGFLYAAVGDSAASGNAQSLDNPLGKILRIDVGGADAYPGDPSRNYAVPSDNPVQFDGISGAAERSAIFAVGLRNPWRASFDAAGRLFVGDVGQGSAEEVNLVRAGANHGWGRGTGRDDGPIEPPDPRYTNPIYSYEHGAVSASITGGYVYRGPGESLQGHYVLGDFVRGTIVTLTESGGAWRGIDRTAQVSPDAGSIGNISSFGEDASGRLYLMDFDGEVFRLQPVGGSADQGDRIAANGGADIVFAGDGNDVVSGGAGADRLEGGNGNDILSGGSGNDTLGGGRENDSLAGGTGADRVSGGSGDDRLAGGGGNDLLGGGAGNDRMLGDSGNDRLFGGGGNDRMSGGSGDDAVSGGVGNDRLAGGSGSDRLNGGAGADTLSGGVGADILVGGAGADAFLFDTVPAATNVDTVRGFDPVRDTIQLENAVFQGLAPGILAPGAFREGAAALDAGDRIVYDSARQALFFDPDGTGGAPQVQFAALAGGPDLSRFDFIVV